VRKRTTVRKKTTVPKTKSKNNILNRAFAAFFVMLSLVFFYYMGCGIGSPLAPLKPVADISPLAVILFFCVTPLGIGFTIIFFGLLKEVWKPSLDFTFRRKRIWTVASIVLFAVVVVNNAWWWIYSGFPNWLPQHGLQSAVLEFFIGNFAVDTTILSLMFGVLFLTNSDPKKSPSYKTILVGTVFWQIVLFVTYLILSYSSIAGLRTPMAERYADFLGYTIFQPWFWTDIMYAIVTFAGAVQLLRRSTNVKKLILIAVVSFIVFFLLVTPFFPKPQLS